MATERDLVLVVVNRGLESLTLSTSGDPNFLADGVLVRVTNVRNQDWPALFKEGEQYRVRFEKLGD